jgi:hypothetical protein
MKNLMKNIMKTINRLCQILKMLMYGVHGRQLRVKLKVALMSFLREI